MINNLSFIIIQAWVYRQTANILISLIDSL